MRKRKGGAAPKGIPLAKVPFKRVAGTLGCLAASVALVNLAVNLFASFTVTNLQIDMSAQGDLMGSPLLKLRCHDDGNGDDLDHDDAFHHAHHALC